MKRCVFFLLFFSRAFGALEFIHMSWDVNGIIMLMESSEEKSYFECHVPKEHAKVEWPHDVEECGEKRIYSVGDRHDNVHELTPFSHLLVDHDEYYLRKPRSLCGVTPKKIDFEEAKGLLKDKKVVVYTGAGISRAAGIPAMKELEAMFTLTKVFEDPEYVLEKVVEFRKKCFSAEPTKAHLAVVEIVKSLGARVLTENLDQLHEKSGIEVLRPHVGKLRCGEGIDFSKVDCLICVGMSKDNRGVISWYKEHNPEGKIVAFNLMRPSYLGDEDYLVEGDVQEELSRFVDFLPLFLGGSSS